MGDEAKSGTHLAVAIQVLTFFFLEHTTISGAIYLKFHLQWRCTPKKKGQHLLSCSFCVTFGPNRHRARVPCHNDFTNRDKRLNSVLLAMLAD